MLPFARLGCCCLLLTGCVRNLAPPPAPTAEVPEVKAPRVPLSQGRSRVLVDVTDGPSTVLLVEGRSHIMAGGYGFTTVHNRTLCKKTPCFVDLPYGSHELVIGLNDTRYRGSAVDLEVGEKNLVLRHSVGRNEPSGGVSFVGVMLLSLGLSATLTGAILYPIASDDSPGLADAGSGMLIGGGIASVLGIVMMVLDPPIQQKGSSTIFDLGGSGEDAGDDHGI